MSLLLLLPWNPPPKVDTLTDDFSTADTAKWTFASNATVSGGRLNIDVTPAYTGVLSVGQYDLTGSSAYIQVVQPPNVGNGTTDLTYQLQVDATNYVRYVLENNALYAQRMIGGTKTTVASSPYDAVNMAWWRISESAGTVTWATSPDGVTWTTFGTWVVAGLALTSIQVYMDSGYYATEPSPGLTLLDNFNLIAPTGVAATASGSVSLGGAATARAVASATTGGISLGSSPASAQARSTAAGAITLGASSSAAAPTTAAGTITLGSTSTATAPSSAAGSVTLSGASTARAAASSTSGGVTLAGSASAAGVPVAATASGGITLNGTSTARASATAAGAVTLSGATSGRAAATSTTGGITLSGSATGGSVSAATASGAIALGGSSTARAAIAGTGGISLGSASAASASPAASGGIALGGTSAAGTSATASGLIVLGGAVTAAVSATVAGAIELNAIANGEAVAVYTPTFAGPGETLTVGADHRLVGVGAETRNFGIPGETRTDVATASSPRLLAVTADNRVTT